MPIPQDDSLIDLTRDDLRQLVAEAVRGTLEALAPAWLDMEGAAHYMTVSEETIRRWRRDGLPSHRLPGRGERGILLFRRSDLDAWAARHRGDSLDKRRGRGSMVDAPASASERRS